MTDPPVLLIPGTPLLVTGVDPCEPPQMKELRGAIRTVVARERTWSVPVPGSSVPSLVSLGGHGVPVGARVHVAPAGAGSRGPHIGVSRPSDMLRGGDLVDAVHRLDAAAMKTASHIPTGVAVAVLTGLEAGVDIRMVAVGDSPAAAACRDDPLLIPLDFSGAAHPDAPLAPREGAAEFDRRLETALSASVDHEQVAALRHRADDHAAWIDMLSPLGLSPAHGVTLAATEVHHVRYRVFSLEPTATPPAPGRDERHDLTDAGRP